MRGRPGGDRRAMWCWALGAMVLLASCTGTHGRGPGGPATSANAITTAHAGTPACDNQATGFVRSPGRAAGSQLVLGRISVNTGYSQMPVPVTGDGTWRYWQKRGILILAGTGPVQISVPPSWRRQAAITYGTTGIVSSLVLTACRQPSGAWDGYAGGIYLRTATSCVPLLFAIGNKSVTIRFSITGRCS